MGNSVPEGITLSNSGVSMKRRLVLGMSPTHLELECMCKGQSHRPTNPCAYCHSLNLAGQSRRLWQNTLNIMLENIL